MQPEEDSHATHRFSNFAVPTGTIPNTSHHQTSFNSSPGGLPAEYIPSWSVPEETAEQRMKAKTLPERKVTDRHWLLAISAFMSLCVVFAITALTEGNPSRLNRGMNYQGKTCGVDPEVRDLPYLYFPLDPRESFASIMLNDGRCIERCPTEQDVENGLTVPIPVRETTVDSEKTSAVTVEFLLQSPAYASSVMADAYCIPLEPSLRTQMSSAFTGTLRQLQMAVGSFASASGPLVGYLMLSVILSFLFAQSIKSSPGTVLMTSVVASILLCFFAGGRLISSGFNGILDRDRGSFYYLDYTWAMFLGFLLLVAGCTLIGVFFVARRHLRTVVRLLESTSDVMGEMQYIYLGPVIFSTATLVWVGGWTWIFGYMASAGNSATKEVAMGLDQNGDLGILPIHREFVWDARFIFFGMLWWCAFFWIIEVLRAFSKFVVAYCGTLWYFSTPDGEEERETGWYPPLRAIQLGWSYHSGSFAIAGLVMGATRPLRILFSWAASKYLGSNFYSPVMDSLKEAFRGILNPITYIVDTFTASGYIEMSISSTPFFPAMDKASIRHQQTRSPAKYFIGASSMISVVGSLLISLIIGLLLYTTLTGTAKYSMIASPSFVTAPLAVSLFAALVAGFIAAHFTSVWTAMADCLMYCFLVESIQPPVVDEDPTTKVYAPASIKDLLLQAAHTHY